MIKTGEKWLPPEKIATLDWLRDEFRLPQEGADLPGPYNVDLVPHLWGIFYALDAEFVRIVAMMKAAQVGWTFGLIGYIGKRVDRQPTAIIVLFPKEGDARSFNDEKLVPSIKSTPAFSRCINTKSRKDGNRALYKSYPGGFLKMVGSNSAGNVKSTPAPLVIVEEPDDTSDNVKDQGDAILLVRERLKRQRHGKLVLGGTPAVKGVSRVEEYVELGTQRMLPIKCHDCGEMHVLDWVNVSWHEADDGPEHPVYGKNLPDTAVYVCPDCGSAWDDWQRYQNILSTVKQAVSDGDPWCGWQATVENTGGVESFKELNELYAAGLPGTSLADVVRDYLNAEYESAKGDQSARIVFVNSKLGRTYEYQTSGPELDDLEKRAEDYAELTVPNGGLCLVAGVDVQHDRFAVRIWAVGRDEEMWLVYWGEVSAKVGVTDINDPAWSALENLLFQSFEHEKGFSLRMSAVSIDCSDGGTSDQVYHWVRKMRAMRRNVMAIKGDSNDHGKKEIFTKPKALDTKGKQNTKASKRGVLVYMVGTHKAKDLLIGDRGRITLTGNGPGRRHWYKDVRDDFYEQTMSEVKAPSKRLRGKLIWQPKSGVRNEGLDCDVYALHASRSLHLDRKPDSWWDDLEAKLLQEDMFTSKSDSTEQKITADTGKRDNWVGVNNNEDWI